MSSAAEVLESRTLLSGQALTGTLWNDLNSDGFHNDSEPGLEGRTVYIDGNNNGLLDNGELSATTDSEGEYSFSGLTAGTYIVRQVLPNGWHSPTPRGAAGKLVSLTGGRDLVFDDARGLLYVTTDRGVVERIDLASGSKLADYSVGVSLLGADITQDGSALYIAEGQASGSQGVIHKINLSDGSFSSVRYIRDSYESGAYDVAIGLDGKGLITTQFAGSGWTPLRHLDTNNDTLTAVVGTHANVRQNTQIHRSGDGSLFLLMEANISSGPIFTYDVATNTFPHSADTDTFVSSARTVLNRDGSLIATTIGGLSIMDRDLKAVENLPGVIEAFAFDPTKDVFYALDKSNSSSHRIVAFDTNTWDELYRFDVGENVSFGGAFGSGTMRVSDDGRFLSMITLSGVRVFDLVNLTGGQTVTVTNSAGAKEVDLGSFAERIPEIRIDDAVIVEGNSGSRSAILTVSLSEPANQRVQITYATADGSAVVSNGDYASAWGTLDFTSGETSKTFMIVVRGDAVDELDEHFFVNLMGASGAVIVDSRGVVTIQNDDAGSRGSIEGTLWNDLDADGVRDLDDGPLVGRTVYLDLNNNGELDSGETTAVTDEDGNYSFSQLPVGDYTVAQVLPNGWIQTSNVGLTDVFSQSFLLPAGSTSSPLYQHADLVFDVSRNQLLITTTHGTIERLDLADMRLLDPLRIGSRLLGADISFDGRHIYVAEGTRNVTQGMVRKVDLENGSVANLNYDLAGREVGAYDVAIGSEGRALVTTQFAGSGWVPLHQLDLASGVISNVAGLGSIRQSTSLHRSADGTGMLLLEANISSGPMHTYDAVTNTFPGQRNANTSLSGVPGAVNRDGSLYAVGFSGLALYDKNLEPIPAPVVPDRTTGLVFHPTRDLLYRASSTHVTVFETEGFTKVAEFPIGETIAFGRISMAVSNDGRHLFLGTSSGVRVYHLVADAQRVTVASGQAVSEVNFSSRQVAGNRDPLVVNDVFQVDEDGVVTSNVLSNDTDPEGQPISVISVNGTSAAVGEEVFLPSGAKITVSADGTFILDTAGAFDALAEGDSQDITFTYVVSDSLEGTATASVTVTVNGSNDAPSPNIDRFTIDDHTTLTDEVLSNDSDIDRDSLVVSAVNGDFSAVGQEVTLASGTKLTVDENGTFAYDPNGKFRHLAVGQTTTDSFTYTVSDGQGGLATATVIITITGTNVAPIAEADVIRIRNGGLFNGNLLANDSDSNDDPLTITSVGGLAGSVGQPVTLSYMRPSSNSPSAGGTIQINADGTYFYDPAGDFTWLQPGEKVTQTISYTISDGRGGTSTASLEIVIEETHDVIVGDVSPATTDTANGQSDSDIGIGSNGRIVVAWTHTTSTGDTDVRFRRYDAKGTPLDAADRLVSLQSSADEDATTVAVAAGGSFVIGYRVTDGGDSDVVFDLYNAAGSFVRRVQLFDSAANAQSNLDLAISSSGNLFAVWQEQRSGNDDVFVQLFDAQGNSVLGPFAIADESTGSSESTPTVAVDRAGNLVVAYGTVSGIAVRRFSASGTQLGARLLLAPPSLPAGDVLGAPQVGRAADGSFVVAYRVTPASGSPYGYWHLLNADGSVRANGSTSPGTIVTSVSMDAIGNFVLGTSRTTLGGDEQAEAIYFNSAGERGDTAVVNQAPAGSQGQTQVALSHDTLAASYSDSSGSGDVEFSLIRQRRSQFGVARPNSSGGLTFFLDSNGDGTFGAGDAVFNFGLAGDIIVVGDWNGDGIDDFGVARSNGSGGLAFYLDGNGNREFDSGDLIFNFGLVGDIIVVGDWNADGIADLGVARRNAGGGLVFSLDSNGSRLFDGTDAVFNFGLFGDIILVGDWDGDGFDQLGVARRNGIGGLVFSLDSNHSRYFEAGQDAVFNFGLERDGILVGDWNGDGKEALGVVRPHSSGGQRIYPDVSENYGFDLTDSLFAFDFGLPDDLLIAGAWR